MQIEVLKSKLHCVTVTEANLNYMGSITIDEDLMDAANLIAGEKVQIVDNNNGERLETYIIKGERGSGCICLNGAAARKVQVFERTALMVVPDTFSQNQFPVPIPHASKPYDCTIMLIHNYRSFQISLFRQLCPQPVSGTQPFSSRPICRNTCLSSE